MSYSSEVLADSPLWYARLGEASGTTMLDASGNHRDGTYQGGVTLGQPSLLVGSADTAALFNGSNGAGVVPYGAWMDVTTTMTVEAVIKTTSTTTVASFVDRDSWGGTRMWQFRLNAGKPEFILIQGAGGIVTAAGPASVADGKAHHIAATYDGAKMRLYVDGVKVTEVNRAGTIATGGGTQILVGMNGSTFSGAQFFPGTIDEPAYFGTCLSDARIAAHALAATTYSRLVTFPVGPVTLAAVAEVIAAAGPAPTVPSRRLAAMLGLSDSLIVHQWHTPSGGGWAADLDRSHALISYTVRYGREAVDAGQPRPVSATVVAYRPFLGSLPTIGERVRITLAPEVADALGLTEDEAARITGEVTDIETDVRITTVTITGELARRSRAMIAAAPTWATQSVAEAVTASLAAVGVAVGTVEPGGPSMRPPRDPSTAASLLALYSPGTGDVIEQRSGRVDWQALDHRRTSAVKLDLTAAEVERAVTWSQHVGDVINTVEVSNPDTTLTVSDHTEPVYSASIKTLAANVGAMWTIALGVLGRRRRPFWTVPTLTAHVARTLDVGQLPDALTLGFGDLCTIPPEAAGPIEGTTAYVEGVTEAATAKAWTLTYAVSDPAQSGSPVRWTDIPHARIWDGLPHTLAWADLATITDPAVL